MNFERLVHLGFFATLAASIARVTAMNGAIPAYKAALVVLFAVVYLMGMLWAKPGWQRWVWLGALVANFTALSTDTACFSWCAVPLFFVAWNVLPMKYAIPVVAYLTLVAAVVSEINARSNWDPSPALAPVAIAVMSMFNYRRLDRENARRQQLIDDLIRAQDALAESERAAGMLQERVRLSREIHDTLAQGLSSMHMLLSAADQEWADSPEKARAHVRQAAAAARENLAEARRFVHDLTPPALDGRSLPDAIRKIHPQAKLRIEGTPNPLDPATETELLRIAQGALANTVEHAHATTVVITLTYLPDTVTLDICDNGIGFDPTRPRPGRNRGYGLRAIHERAKAMGGTATVDSAPGEGTVVAVCVPIKARGMAAVV
ncbi:sensor histidine kinase [Sinosporangium siamense]|uniref:Oxygen sensor histidine kinase NreB n=2 Tax=Sinosporangium siamense TaxID=1367973 RepID=A0A919RJH2_9ACTN|nr:sensor histidine kinase [Sinosporangium siamense]GII94986.1 two-component sensor histidine kinase [Sinosporangium siamense]